MSNVLEFYIRMKDFMSSGLIKVAKTAKTSMGEVKQAIESVTASNKKMGDSFDGVERKARSAGMGLAGYARNLAGIIGIAGGLALATGMVQDAAKMGATRKSFDVLTGSEQTGSALTSGLQGLARDTVLGPEVYKHAQTMLGFGIGAADVLPNMKMLGDVAMGDAAKLEGLVLAFSQVEAAGKLTGQEVLQFVNAGFNPLKEISDKTGVSMGDLRKQMEKGAISADMVKSAFASATGEGGKFNNMMNVIGQTTYGRIVKLQGQWEEFKVKTGEALLPIAESFISIASFLMDHADLVIAATAAWGAYKLMTMEVTKYQEILNLVMALNPLMLIISLLAGLVVWLVTVRDKTKSWNESLRDLWQTIKGLAEIIGLVFKNVLTTVTYYLEKAMLKVFEFLEGTIGALGKVGKALGLAATGDIGGALAVMATPVENATTKHLAGLEDAYKAKQFENETKQILSMSATRDSWGRFTGKGKTQGVTPSLATGTDLASLSELMGGGGSKASGGRDAASGITSGGPRVININGVKFADKIEIHADSTQAGVNNLQGQLEEMFLRVLNSGAYVQ
jgi:tape measure domain-containing protein